MFDWELRVIDLFHIFWCCCYKCTSKNYLAAIWPAAGSTELFTWILSWARVRAIIQYYPNASPLTVNQLTFLQQQHTGPRPVIWRRQRKYKKTFIGKIFNFRQFFLIETQIFSGFYIQILISLEAMEFTLVISVNTLEAMELIPSHYPSTPWTEDTIHDPHISDLPTNC